MLRLYERAGIEPKLFDMVHWSITSNADYACLYIQWTRIEDGKQRFYTTLFGEARLGSTTGGVDPPLLDMRHCLRNILEGAQTRRLLRIKFVLKRIQEALTKQRASASATSRTPSSSMKMPATPPLSRLKRTPHTPTKTPKDSLQTPKKPRVESPKERYKDDGEPD